MGSRSDSQAWSSAEKGLMLSAVILITLSAFESLATTTIMPNVVASFHADSWFAVASGTALITNLIANVLAGGLSDAIGVKKVFAWGLILFCVGLLISAFAPHIAVFVLGRLVQGLGGGFIIVPLYVLVGAIATPLHRPRYFAAFSLSWVFPALVGPALAGFIATYWGWRIVLGVAPFLAIFGAIPLHSVLKGVVSTPQGRLPLCALPSLGIGFRFGCLPLADFRNFSLGVGDVSGWNPRFRALNLYSASPASKGNLQIQAWHPSTCHDSFAHDGSGNRCRSCIAFTSSTCSGLDSEFSLARRYC